MRITSFANKRTFHQLPSSFRSSRKGQSYPRIGTKLSVGEAKPNPPSTLHVQKPLTNPKTGSIGAGSDFAVEIGSPWYFLSRLLHCNRTSRYPSRPQTLCEAVKPQERKKENL